MLNLKVAIRWLLSVTRYLSLVMCYLISNAFYLKLALLCKNLFPFASHNLLFWHLIYKLTQKKLKWFWSAFFFMFYVFLNSFLKVQPALYNYVILKHFSCNHCVQKPSHKRWGISLASACGIYDHLACRNPGHLGCGKNMAPACGCKLQLAMGRRLAIGWQDYLCNFIQEMKNWFKIVQITTKNCKITTNQQLCFE